MNIIIIYVSNYMQYNCICIGELLQSFSFEYFLSPSSASYIGGYAQDSPMEKKTKKNITTHPKRYRVTKYLIFANSYMRIKCNFKSVLL